jgi:hypothetical protein
MNVTDFAGYMDQERARIHKECGALLAQKSAIEQHLTQLNRDMQAIDAYAAAKAGKAAPTRGTRPAASNGARPGSRRVAIIDAVGAHPRGLARRELIEMLGVKGSKSGEMAISNALTAMIKNNVLARNDEKKYVLAA